MPPIMKYASLHTLALVTTFAGLSQGCSQNASCESESCKDRAELRENKTKWQAEGPSSYEYTLVTQSFTAARTETKYTVRNGALEQREFQWWERDRDNNEQLFDAWTETTEQLGDNDHYYGLWTMDDLYTHCEETVLNQDPDENEITLTFGDDGALDVCEYRAINCADDCSSGFDVGTLTAL